MEEKVEERIEFYCQIYERINQRVSKLNLENAGEIALEIFDEVTKDLRDGIVAQRGNENNQRTDREKEKLATEKQREALHKFGVKQVPGNITIKEASKILNRLINLSKANDKTAIDRAVEELNRDWV